MTLPDTHHEESSCPTDSRSAAPAGDQNELLRTCFGQLSGNLLHRLGTMLAPVILAVERLRMGTQDATAIQRADTISSCIDGAASLVRRLGELMDDTGAPQRPLDCRRLLDEVLVLVRELLPARIELDTEVAPDLWPVRAQPSRLKLALLGMAACPHSMAGPREPRWRSVRLRAFNRGESGGSGRQVVLEVVHLVAGSPGDEHACLPQLPPGLNEAALEAIIAEHHGQLETVRQEPLGVGVAAVLPALPEPQNA